MLTELSSISRWISYIDPRGVEDVYLVNDALRQKWEDVTSGAPSAEELGVYFLARSSIPAPDTHAEFDTLDAAWEHIRKFRGANHVARKTLQGRYRVLPVPAVIEGEEL